MLFLIYVFYCISLSYQDLNNQLKGKFDERMTFSQHSKHNFNNIWNFWNENNTRTGYDKFIFQSKENRNNDTFLHGSPLIPYKRLRSIFS